MLVRTFQAAEMSEALRMVKAEMGLDAMILSSKKERRKGILGYFSKPYFEVTAALEPKPFTPRGNPYREEPVPAPPERELSTKEEFQNSMLGPLAREVRELKQRIEALTKPAAPQAPPQIQVQPEPEPEQGPRTFAKEELDEIKKLLFDAVASKDKAPRPVTFPSANGVPVNPVQQEAEALREQLSRLQVPKTLGSADLAPRAAEARPQAFDEAKPVSLADTLNLAELLNLADPEPACAVEAPTAPAAPVQENEQLAPLLALANELRAEELSQDAVEMLLEGLRPAAEDGAELDELRGLLSETLAGMIKCTGNLRLKKSGPRIMAMVGPTGVGKTTTIAKLAAMHALNKGAKVALVTTDNFRVGAIEQLKTYAKIMDLPLEVVATSQDLAKALGRHADKDLILIDTAGRSPKDTDRLDELKGYLECQPGIETYLCLSATTRLREMDEIVANFGTLPIGKLLFTKLDESESFGCIVDAQLKHKLPLSYFTTGQRVPEDIEVATSRKLAALVVKEGTR